MKLLCVISLLFVLSLGHSQGLELMPKENYDKLPSPPSLAGSGGRISLPENYVIPEWAFPTPSSQGSQPSCTAWASGYAFMSFYQANKNGWGLTTQEHIFSPSYLYQNIKGEGECANCKCGTYISDALNFLKNTGNVPITDCPYDAKSCKKPSSSLSTVASQYKIKNWYRVENVRNLTDLKSYLSRDIPVIIATYTDDAFAQYYNKKETDTFHWNSGEDKGGNHAMLLVGYDDKRSAFKIMNSWGKNWGVGGYVWVDYESFRTMIVEAYVVEKDYVLTKGNDNDTTLVVTVDETKDPLIEVETTSDISDEYFQLYGYSEEIREGRNYYTFGFVIDEEVQDLISKVVYVYDDPSFRNKYSTITEGPHYASSYEGWGCITTMHAVIYFTDGTTLAYDFDGCALIEEYADYDWEAEDYEYELVEIDPVIYVEETETRGQYAFSVELHGIEVIKDDIVKVVYDRNHSSFTQRYQTVTDAESNFSGGYIGWGCLESLIVTIYYTDETTESFEINMCEALGW